MMNCVEQPRMIRPEFRAMHRRSIRLPDGKGSIDGRPQGSFGNNGRMGMWASVEIPQEIRDKQAEMGTLH